METVSILLICLFAGFVQGVSGFGSALIAMPLLLPLLGADVAPSMMIIGGIPGLLFMIARYRTAFSLKTVWRLSAASVVMIPAGVWIGGHVDVRVIYAVLSGVLVLYAVYALSGAAMPRLRSSMWAFVAGVCSGLLGGACNTDGPPVVVYGDCAGWSPNEFKVNLQSFFLVNTVIIIVSQWGAGNVTPAVLNLSLIAAPGILAGVAAGVLIDRYINPAVFRRTCLVILLLLGVRLGYLAAAGQ